MPAMRINRGDVFGVSPDVDGTKQSNPHPHVVIQDDDFNPRRASESGNVLLDPGEGNLPRRSVVVEERVSSVEKKRLGEWIGTLSEERVTEVLAGPRFPRATYFGGCLMPG